MAKASAQPDGLVVLATIFHACERNDTYMQPLLDSLTQVLDEGTSVRLSHGEKERREDSVMLSHMLPDERDLFFRYSGSLTTPPCSQSVTWIVFRDISAISAPQLSYFRNLTKHDEDDHVVRISHNVRGLQLTEDRRVWGSVRETGFAAGILDRVRQVIAWFGLVKRDPVVKLM